jgi:hypothetical protein
MNSNEPTYGDDHDASASIAALEDALRRLPQISVPSDLEGKLMAAIPQRTAVAERRASLKQYVWWFAFSAAAAVIISASILLGRSEERIDRPEGITTADGREGSLVVDLVLSKETDPCNILPPLGDWR